MRLEAWNTPVMMADLEDGERLIVRLMRRWVQCLRDPRGGYPLAVMCADLQDCLGRRDGEAALPAFMRLTHILSAYARLPYQIHWPCCSQVSADEQGVVAVIAACQAGDLVAARDLAQERLQIDGVPECLQVASRIAGLLSPNGVFLPQRRPRPGAERPADAPRRPASLTMH